MEGERDAKKRVEGSENHYPQLDFLVLCTNEGETGDDGDMEDVVRAKNFNVDYSVRGTAKCKACKKVLEKDTLCIGKPVPFKDRVFL